MSKTKVVRAKKRNLRTSLQRSVGEHDRATMKKKDVEITHGRSTGKGRKRAETTTKRLAAVVRSASDAIVTKNLNGIITDWNQSARRVFGYKANEVIGKSILILIPKDLEKEHAEILKKVRRGESVDHFETVRRCKDGRLIDVSLTISPVRDPNGEIVAVSKIARDITQAKQTERRLAEQSRLLDLTNSAILVRDARDRIVHWNRGAQEVYGYSRSEALGKEVHTLLRTEPPRPLSQILEEFERKGRWEGELVHVCKDGSKITVMSRWALDRDGNGNPASVLETNTDITERKQIETAARRLQEISTFQIRGGDVDVSYQQILDAAVSIMRSDSASIQMLHHGQGDSGELRLLAFRGFNRKAAKFWQRVELGSQSTCGKALQTGKRCVVSDVEKCNFMAGSGDLKTYLQTGIRAVQTTPLVSRRGKMLGMISTHWRKPHQPSERDFDLFDALARQAADIVERRQFDGELRQKEAELELLIRQTPFMLTRCTRDLHYRYVSRAYAKMIGRKPEEIAGKPIVEIMGEKGLKTILPYITKVLKGRTVEYEMEVPFHSVGNQWLHCIYTPDWDFNGNVVGWFGSLTDIRQRKEADAVLRKSRKVLQKLVRERTRELRVANKELQAEIDRRKGLEGEILAVSDREQQRLGQELHDGLCQHLTAVAFMARSIALRLRNHRVIDAEDIDKIADLVNNAATDTRELSRALHRIDVDAVGLRDALQDLVNREIWKTPCRLEVEPSFQLDDDAVAAQVYRIAREAVINANKHARAREIVVRLERSGKEMVLHVIDNGGGFSQGENVNQGLGRHIMNYRARLTGGRLEIKSRPGRGTRVSCYFSNSAPESLLSIRAGNHEPERVAGRTIEGLPLSN